MIQDITATCNSRYEHARLDKSILKWILLGYEMVGRTLTVFEENQIMRFCEQTDHEQSTAITTIRR